jgi:hypothetical protein
MNTPDPERLLASFQPRQLPPAWKADILDAACRARQRRGPICDFRIERAAWATIAASWIVVIALRITTPAIAIPPGPPVSAAEVAAHWEQIRHFAELTRPEPLPEPAPPMIHLEMEFHLPAHSRS